ncbi:ATP-binding protein [Asanoa iriomotensis]|uniref:XRE family transcriptional regulator n=1 Tax=Asanoa iriomotensis TaxID=234613 RepID=A0ABQ4CHM3_9ACTN|nr:helix-turn-helix domain-containing protein [Asanoa iriomotensis]GIF61810.1 XRE family transcriptional regulator [Asanoa iriomotensis]
MTADHGADQGFDALLKAHRREAGLTQHELATRAGVGVRTVRDLERGRASRPQRTTVDLLADALHLAGTVRAEFVAVARGAVPPAVADERPTVPAFTPLAPASVAASRGRGLPPPGPLVGRDLDVAEVALTLLRGVGLVSLVGLAGVGKTSVALAVIERVKERHPAGVAGIVITEGSTESDVLTAAATVLGVARSDELAGRLSGAPSLLLVDAVERAPGAVAEALHRLVAVAPSLRILATGRHPVGLPGERVWPVVPLEVPPHDDLDLSTVSKFPAVALFLDRLRRVRRDPLEPGEVGALVRLVRRLGGLPLAIELAAARGRVLDMNQILDRYGHRLLDLAGQKMPGAAPDAVTLRDAVAASYRLLEPHEQVAVRRLSPFRNRWSVELGEAMLADTAAPGGALDGDPVPLLDRLVALGLLGMRGSGSMRFRLLDVVRDYAEEQAAAEGELAPIRRRHALVMARFAARVAPELAGGTLPGAVARLDEVSSDLWGALAHSAIDDPHTALLLAANLPRWWRFRGRDAAGRQWLRRLLDDPRTADADPVLRAWAQLGVAQLAAEHSAASTELPAAEEALATFREQGDVTGELAARNQLSGLWMSTGGYDEARRHGAAALTLATRTGRTRDMAVAQSNLAWHEIRVGDLAAARRRMAAVDRLAAQCGEDRLRALALANTAEVNRLDGRYDDAVKMGRRALGPLERLGDPGHRARVLGTIGLALALADQLDEALAVLASLRAVAAGADPGVGDAPASDVQGPSAMIEATLAARRGDRVLAAEWFGVAVQSFAGGRDLRDVAEALVGLASATDDPANRAAVIERLDAVCKEGGITLLPSERARAEHDDSRR